MIELYSVKDVAKLFNQSESRLRYWIQSGFLWPSVRRGGQYFYTFDDLITIRTAVELLDSGVSAQKVRKALVELRKELPEGVGPNTKLRICSDGTSVVVIQDDIAYEAQTKQLVMAFAVSSINTQIAEVLPLRPATSPAMNLENSAVPTILDDAVDQTIKQGALSAYQLFLHACVSEEKGDDNDTEIFLRQAISIEDSMAAAHTNLGNLLHRQGKMEEAKSEYDKALIYEPEQPEARYNLGNLLEEMGQREAAIAELRHVCTRCPDFADAHYNLGILLADVGGNAQAQEHLNHYLSMDGESSWAKKAREFLAS